ncbi:MAG: GntR family transcriptional regulator [Marinosulfonomonas sp.]|nr:GntR family transcriptional regulator [Marinosulfonomonas sp.]
MRTRDLELKIRDYVRGMIQQGDAGQRLPRVRDLMSEFGTSQRVVARALEPLKVDGLISSAPGAGLRITRMSAQQVTYEADCLILYRGSKSLLAQNLLLKLVERLRKSGLQVTLAGFNQEVSALKSIAKLGRFRCCLLQTNFEIVSVGFLAKIREHADSLVIDGVSVTGIDADVIGTNWREALSISYRELNVQGHDRIGFLTSSHDARQIAMSRREFSVLSKWDSPKPNPLLFQVDHLPGAYQWQDIVAALPGKEHLGRENGYTALIVWGLVDGYLMSRAMQARGLRAGIDFSVILMGSVDFHSEHMAQFDTIGNSNAEKLDLFESVVRARIGGDPRPEKTHYLPVHMVTNGSVKRL